MEVLNESLRELKKIAMARDEHKIGLSVGAMVSYHISTIKKGLKKVERHTPKKIVSEDYECPNCNRNNTYLNNDWGVILVKYKYCPDCGQALDWSE